MTDEEQQALVQLVAERLLEFAKSLPSFGGDHKVVDKWFFDSDRDSLRLMISERVTLPGSLVSSCEQLLAIFSGSVEVKRYDVFVPRMFHIVGDENPLFGRMCDVINADRKGRRQDCWLSARQVRRYAGLGICLAE